MVEEHSDQFIREDTVANLIDVKRFFQDILKTAKDLYFVECLNILHDLLLKEKSIVDKVWFSFILLFYYL